MENNFNLNTYDVTQTDRVVFIKKTYAHVALAFLAFIIFEGILLSTPFAIELGYTLSENWLIVIGLFMGGSWLANKWVLEPGNIRKQYLGLFSYAFFQAIIFLPMIVYLLTSDRFYGEVNDIIAQAGIVSLGLFTGLSAVAIFSKKDFSFLRSILTIGFGIALALIIASFLIGFDLGLAFSGAMVFLAGGSILYQTSRLVHDYHANQHVAAALSLFASFMLLFYYILQIFMSRD